MRVALEPIHDKWAHKIAIKRFAWSRKQRWSKANNAPINIEMDILGCRAEIAGKLFLNPVDWAAYVEKSIEELKKLADLDTFIDVKAIEHPHHCLCAAVGAVWPDWAYLLVEVRYPQCFVRGWLWGEELMEYRPEERVPGRLSHFVPQSRLRDPNSLIPILREKQCERSVLAQDRAAHSV